MRLGESIRFWLKGGLVVVMTLVILIPLAMIGGVIEERQQYRQRAVAEIARSYAGAQAFAGPVLVVPYSDRVRVREKGEDGVVREVERDVEGQWTFFPATLEVGGTLRPSVRRLGLHEVRVYEWQAEARARFDAAIPHDDDPTSPRTLGEPWLSYGVADVRGLVAMPRLRIDGIAADLQEGFGARAAPGVHARLPVPQPGQRLRLDTALAFTLGGTESLALVPLGKTNMFAIGARWPHPRFGGSFLPRERRIDAGGFRAQWQIAAVASGAQSQFLQGTTLPGTDCMQREQAAGHAPDVAERCALDPVTVSLVDPVNAYSQADRAIKYGVLFVLLTFVGFFLFELIKQLPVHPIQYALVGLAIAIFFLLLVSLSEHIAFGWAYLVASVACIGLIGFYLAAVLRSALRGAGFAAMLATLYAALYGLLLSEDNALLLGSGLLFVVLAAIMTVTRRVDWYRLGGREPQVA
ncbi:MAG TPA: cell envelope integrity protein CreD [Lysobacter sp.]|nr:cell envelope integrity protein CreD [Lysobacter sp.]